MVLALPASPICRRAAQTDGALGRPKPATVKLFHSLMNPGGTSGGETGRLDSQMVDEKPRRSDDNCTLGRVILRINVSTLVLSVLIILPSNPGSACSITA